MNNPIILGKISDPPPIGKWIPDIKGKSGSRTWEISVIREDNEFVKGPGGSYGWFDKNKLLIGHDGGPCQIPVIPMVWNGLVKLAKEVAESLNKQEGNK